MPKKGKSKKSLAKICFHQKELVKLNKSLKK